MCEADTIENGVHFIHMFKQRIKDVYARITIGNCFFSKALQYKHFKTTFETFDTAYYMHIDLPYMYKKISNFRCSSHSPMIEKGRHQKIDRSLRFCPMCLKRNAYVVEDEFHFFLICPTYTEIRNIYFKPKWLRSIVTPFTR